MNNHLSHVFLFIFLAIVLWGAYLIFKPFLVSVFLAFVLFTLFRKIYKKVKKGMGGGKAFLLYLCVF